MMCTKMVPEEEDQMKGYAVKNAENKRRLDNNQKDNHVQQPRTRDRMLVDKVWREPTRLCNKVRHMARDCMNTYAATATQRALVVNQRVPTCFECGRQGHYKNECPKLKNQTRADRSFVSSTFCALLDVIPSTLDVSYAVELAVGRIL
ncbi:reverse transcriptase domain-containing protein [Tanacetum coccineum]